MVVENVGAREPLSEQATGAPSAWLQALLAAQTAAGGFRHAPDANPDTEVTALAILALEAAHAEAGAVERGRNWLRQLQRADGGWPLTEHVSESSWATPWVLLALADDAHSVAQIDRGTAWLVRREGRRIGRLAALILSFTPAEERTDLDPTLVGWPWYRESFSWVEPTAVALLALKKLRPRMGKSFPSQRVEEGERLLYDRECKGGGWNYGNRAVLGEQLTPYPDSTAVALIALQDQPRERNDTSLRALQTLLASPHVSGLALALGAICFSLYGEEIGTWSERLAAAYERARFLDETRTLALALMATSGSPALRIG